MAFVEKEQDIPTVVEYHSAQETAENGIVYHRIFDDSYRIRGEAYNPVKLQYGYRWTDKKMFVYDFEKQEESLAWSVGTTLQSTGCIYDLQGRRLLSQPAKGFHIRDGQKVYAQ
jgi:hypothetical protein